MRRIELITMTNEILNSAYQRKTIKVTSNSLIYDFTDSNYALLKSYDTIVGIMNKSNATLYIFDYYSTTTYKHIHKAAKMLNAMRITWLYRRSDGIIEMGISPYANTYKYTRIEYSQIENSDFIGFISNKWFTGNRKEGK